MDNVLMLLIVPVSIYLVFFTIEVLGKLAFIHKGIVAICLQLEVIIIELKKLNK